MRYMLDTNTCIHIIKYRPATLYDRLSFLSIEDAGVSSIVAACRRRSTRPHF
jgi:tRNA(fMet)-specific endonuclease VapC